MKGGFVMELSVFRISLYLMINHSRLIDIERVTIGNDGIINVLLKDNSKFEIHITD